MVVMFDCRISTKLLISNLNKKWMINRGDYWIKKLERNELDHLSLDNDCNIIWYVPRDLDEEDDPGEDPKLG